MNKIFYFILAFAQNILFCISFCLLAIALFSTASSYNNPSEESELKLEQDDIKGIMKGNPSIAMNRNAVLMPKDANFLVSGGGLSENGKFSYGYSSFRGKRASMEDFHETRISEVDGQMVGLFGVFDGHGGSRAAEYVKQNLFENLVKNPNFVNDTKAAIVEAYKQTDTDYLKAENGQHRDAGSTASTVILVGGRLLVANVGDSRVVACRAGEGEDLLFG